MDVDMEDAADDDARVRDDDDGGEDMMEVDAELVAMTLHELRCARGDRRSVVPGGPRLVHAVERGHSPAAALRVRSR